MAENRSYRIKFYSVPEEAIVPQIPPVAVDSKEAAVLHAAFKIWATEMMAINRITIPYAEDLDAFLNAYNGGYLRVQIEEPESQVIEA